MYVLKGTEQKYPDWSGGVNAQGRTMEDDPRSATCDMLDPGSGAFLQQAIDDLFILAGPQSDHNQSLGFTAGEDGRAMGAGQNPYFDGNGPDFIEGSPIGSGICCNDVLPFQRFQKLLSHFLHL